MKAFFEEPKMNVINLSEADVITTSGYSGTGGGTVISDEQELDG